MIAKIIFGCFLFCANIFPQNNIIKYSNITDTISFYLKMKPMQIAKSPNKISAERGNISLVKINPIGFAAYNIEKDTTSALNNKRQLPKWYSMVSDLPSDWLTYYKQEFTTDNIPKYLGIAVLTAGLIMTDEKTWRESERFYNRTAFNKNFSDIFTEIGDGRTQFGLAIGFGVYGFISKDDRAIRTASEIVEAVLAAGGVIQLIKHVTGRESPFVETKSGGAWRFFPNQIEYHKHVPAFDAFPSGHIGTSMAAFMVISENYPEIKWLEPASFVLAGFIGFGMANKGIHWYSDYPLGIALGYIFGKIIAHPDYLTKQNITNKKDSISILPYFNSMGNGLSFSYQF
jgi:PAP2 superfamily